MESTEPANGTALAQSPGKVVLHFDQQVSVSPTSIEVFNASAKRIDSGSTKHAPNDSRSVETAIPTSLPAGGYVVTWRVVSADSHPVNGAFTFFIGAATGAGSISAEAGRLLARSAGSRTVGIAYGIVRFLAFVAVAVFLGGVVFATLIWAEAAEHPRTRRIVWSGLVLLALTTAAAFALQGAYGAGLGVGDALKANVLRAVWDTRFGKSYAARLAFVAVAALLVPRLWRSRPSPMARAVLLSALGVLGVAILATWGVADHASTGSLVWLAVPFDVVHLGAASIWLGGLVVAIAVVLPASGAAAEGTPSPMSVAMPRYSQWALAAVVAVVATGVFAAWRQVGVSWGALTTTSYGKLVLYKTGGLVVLVMIASVSRTTVHGSLAVPGSRTRTAGGRGRSRPIGAGARPVGADVARPSRRSAPARLRTAIAAEIVVVLAVLAVTAGLVNARPANQAYAAPFSTEVKAGPTLVDVVVDPAKAGPLAVHLYILTSAGLIDDVPEVDATMSNPGAGITGLKVPVQLAGPGHYVAYGFDVPLPGTWTIVVTVRTDAIDEYFTEPITVRIR
ncbi:MAG TPA: copper resistance protein CopC [Acidimicrobiales bacterium]